MRLGRSITAMAGSTAATLVGLFLAVSPWLQGTQSGHASWSKATMTDFWSGVGVGVIGLVTLVLYRSRLTRELVEAGLMSRPTTVDENSFPNAAAAMPEATLSDEDLLQYATSIVKDWADSEHVLPEEALVSLDNQEISEEELVRIAQSLLQEIQGEPTAEESTETKAPSASSDEANAEPLALMSENELAHMAADLLQEIQQSRQRDLVRSGGGNTDYEKP